MNDSNKVPARQRVRRLKRPAVASASGEVAGRDLDVQANYVLAPSSVVVADRVGGIVIAAGSVDPGLERITWYQRIAAVRPFVWILPRPLVNANAEVWTLAAQLRELAPALRRIRVPVIIVHGTDDANVPYANVAYMRRAFAQNPAVEVIRLDGYDHFLPQDAPFTIDVAVRRMAAQLDATVNQARSKQTSAGWPKGSAGVRSPPVSALQRPSLPTALSSPKVMPPPAPSDDTL